MEKIKSQPSEKVVGSLNSIKIFVYSVIMLLNSPLPNITQVRTYEFSQTIRKCCIERNDDWGHAVLGKIEYYSEDLHAADCV